MFSLTYDSNAQPAQMTIAGSLTIYEVREAHSALIDLLTADNAVNTWHLDLSALEELDTAGAQLLLSVRKFLQQAGISLVMHNPCAAVVELLDLLRLNALQPAAEPAHA